MTPCKPLTVSLLLALLIVPATATAGAANAGLRCVSRDKKLVIEGDIPGDFAEFKLTVAKNGKSKTYSDKTGDRIVVFGHFSKRIFTLAVLPKKGVEVRMFALPRSVRVKSKGHSTKGTFTVQLIVAPNPGVEDPMSLSAMIRGLKLTCTYDHTI